MKFAEKIDEFIKNKTRVIINGMPSDDETRGIILRKDEDFIEFEMLNIQTEKKSNKEKQTREIVLIPLDKINDISLGEQEKVMTGFEKGLSDINEKQER